MAANRLLKDWRNSDKVNILSVHAERFFIRLIMTTDDYGCFYGDARLLRVNLFPLLIDSIREADILRWMAECQKAGLIVIYEIEKKKYIHILNFGQRLRQKTLKFPLPVDYQEEKTMSAECQHHAVMSPLELEVEEKLEEKMKENAGKPETQKQLFSNDQKKSFGLFENWILENAHNVSKMKEPFSIDQYISLSKEFKGDAIKDLLTKMHNYVPLLRKNNSANLTFRNWAKRDYNRESQPIQKTNSNLSNAVRLIENGN